MPVAVECEDEIMCQWLYENGAAEDVVTGEENLLAIASLNFCFPIVRWLVNRLKYKDETKPNRGGAHHSGVNFYPPGFDYRLIIYDWCVDIVITHRIYCRTVLRGSLLPSSALHMIAGDSHLQHVAEFLGVVTGRSLRTIRELLSIIREKAGYTHRRATSGGRAYGYRRSHPLVENDVCELDEDDTASSDEYDEDDEDDDEDDEEEEEDGAKDGDYYEEANESEKDEEENSANGYRNDVSRDF